MVQYNQRRDPLRLMWRRLLAVILLIVIAVVIRGVWGVYLKAEESRALRDEAEAKLADLQKRELELRTEISNLKSDRGIEAEFREHYDLAKEGEGVVVIVDSPESSSQSSPSAFDRFKSFFGR